jgi:hypothetical protein
VIRLCVIGNSHLAAYKLGWDALTAAGDPVGRAVRPTFFGAPRDGLRQVKQEAGRIIPTRRDIAEGFARMSGGHREIVLAEYDAVFLVGLSLSVKRILRFYRTHRWHGLSPDPARVMVPVRFVREFLTARYGETLLAETAAKIRAGTNAPVVAVAEPFWAATVRHDSGDKPDYGWDAAIRNGDAGQLAGMYCACAAGALRGLAAFVAQAPGTVEDSILTRARFNKDASRLISGEGGGTDAAHMNGDFGRAMWPHVVAALRDAGQASAA